MSRFQAEIARRGLPFPIPDALEALWRWLEAHDLGFDEPDGYFLALAEEVDGVYFDSSLTLDDVAGPDAPGRADLLPIAEIDDDGTMALLWRREDGRMPVVALGRERAATLCDDVASFCHLLAQGRADLSAESVAAPPDPELAEVCAPLRAWLRASWPRPTDGPLVTSGTDPFPTWADERI